jgi:hypothetical protein
MPTASLLAATCLLATLLSSWTTTFAASAPTTQPITFSTNFEGASLGKIEAGEPGANGTHSFRLYVPGQYDQRGHNRQTSWFFFRMENVRGRSIELTLTDLVGEYNDRPGAVPYGPDIVPVFSADRKTWTHFPPEEVKWDAEKMEMTLSFTPKEDAIWIAHIPPYVTTDLAALLEAVGRSPHARIETIGKTAGGRDIPMVTVTDFTTDAASDAEKKCVWLQARQHAWEAGTSWAMDGALRFITSDEPKAAELRKTTIFRFIPMVDLDGVAGGKIRFNANGYDVNRNWLKVDLRDPKMLKLMPEIWYTKKAITAAHLAGPKISLLVNLHNTETGEYLATFTDEEKAFAGFQRLYDGLVERTGFDPSVKLEKPRPAGVIKPPTDTTSSLWNTHQIPAALMELRVGTVKKLGHRRTVEEWRAYGRELITEMANAVK